MARPKLRHLLVLPAICLALPALAGPPLSRLDAALDLSTPEAAVRTYSEAFADDDFIAVYFTLSPVARRFFILAITQLRFDLVVSNEADYETLARVTDGDWGPYEHAEGGGNALLSLDRFQTFEVVLWSADQLGIHAIDFAGPVTVQSVGEVVDGQFGQQVTVDATDAVEGPVRFLLQLSPSGRWRVLTVTARPDSDNPVIFLQLY